MRILLNTLQLGHTTWCRPFIFSQGVSPDSDTPIATAAWPFLFRHTQFVTHRPARYQTHGHSHRAILEMGDDDDEMQSWQNLQCHLLLHSNRTTFNFCLSSNSNSLCIDDKGKALPEYFSHSSPLASGGEHIPYRISAGRITFTRREGPAHRQCTSVQLVPVHCSVVSMVILGAAGTAVRSCMHRGRGNVIVVVRNTPSKGHLLSRQNRAGTGARAASGWYRALLLPAGARPGCQHRTRAPGKAATIVFVSPNDCLDCW